MARYPKYPYYVVEKTTGLVWAGADYREDAKDFQKDLPIPPTETTVLMAKSVLSRYGRVQWAKG